MNDVELSHLMGERQTALDAVLHSATFLRNPRLGKLLRYLCERSFAGESGSLKEYTIATDVFDRQSDFDQSTDAIVRVEMHRLRKKLKDFYAGEGQDQKFEIVIQSGNYAPEFLERHPAQQSSQEPEWAAVTPEPLIKTPEPTATPSTSRGKWSLGLILGVCLGTILAFYLLGRNRIKTPQQDSSGLSAAAAPSVADSSAIRILAGAKDRVRDNEGNTWNPDQFFSGGTVQENADVPIYRTRSGSLFRSARTGEFSYAIPLKPGFYELHLYFADTAYTPGISMEGGENTRFFNVILNGHIVLRNFDIIANAGPDTAYERVFKDVQPDKDGLLHINFNREVGVPILNAIEILPAAAPHRMRPVRISTQDSGFTDKAGLAWQPDDYFLNGRSIAKYGIAAGPADSQIFARERYGHFSYAIPAASGTYELKLYFAETYFGPGQQGGGGAGDRVFDVYCNGVVLLSGLDVFREAGAAHQLIKTFHDVEPNAQGNVLISFVPRVNYAMISALELIDETGQ